MHICTPVPLMCNISVFPMLSCILHPPLPSLFAPSLSHQVLFVGEALQLFKRDPQKHELEGTCTSYYYYY